MIYDGKQAHLELQEKLKQEIQDLGRAPRLAIISVSKNRSIQSFIAIKRKFAEVIGVEITEYNYEERQNESHLVEEIKKLVTGDEYDGIIVQLPLPPSYDNQRVLNAVPKELDVDILGEEADMSFKETGTPLPTVVGAIRYIVEDSGIDLSDKKIVVVGHGRLVGKPIATWLLHTGLTPQIIDIATEETEKKVLLSEADVIITGSGVPHLIKPRDIKDGVVLIDAGTSEQSGVLAGDCDPECNLKASLFTPVPGGVGPLTVAFLFKNLVDAAKKKWQT